MCLAVAKIVEIHELSHSNDYEELGQTACHGYPKKKQVTSHAVAASISLVISHFPLFPMLILRKSLFCPAGYSFLGPL